MTIALAKDVEAFLQEQVRAGVSSDASELVNDVLRSIRDQQSPSFEVSPELEAWLLEAADKPVSPLTSHDFEGIRERVRTRLKSSGAWAFTSPKISFRTWNDSSSGMRSTLAGMSLNAI